MTELGEVVAIILEHAPASRSGKCWLCSDGEDSEHGKSELEADPPHTKNLSNNSTKLGAALKKARDPRPEWAVNVEGKEWKITPGAHHCIPGNESLKKSRLEHEIDSKSLTYDVNHANNGVWLPAAYGVGWGSKGDSFRSEFADQSSEQSKRQFHGYRHVEYSAAVEKTLEGIWAKIKGDEKGEAKCLLCDSDKGAGKARPSNGVAARLDAVSAIYRSFLCCFPINSKLARKLVDNGIYTSNETKRLLESLCEGA